MAAFDSRRKSGVSQHTFALSGAGCRSVGEEIGEPEDEARIYGQGRRKR